MVAAGVLIGWAIGNSWLISVVPGLTAMNPLTALCFILAATALVLSPLGATGLRRGWIVGVAVVIAGCGIVRLSAYAFGWDLPVDQILFSSQLDLGGAQPNRMAPNTAFNFAACGFALIALVAGRTRWAQLALMMVALTSGIALLGYAYSVTSLMRVAAFIPMALHTATLFVMVCAAMVCTMPEVGIVAMLTRRSPGGRVVRLMLPAFVFGPPLFGWLRLQGESAGLYTQAFGVAMLIGTMVVLGLALTWKIARALDLGESERRRADEMLLKLAHYDSLTGLPNRLLLDERLERALARADREGHTVAMLFLDLDGFKRINDTHGHEAGDQVLKEAARRILSAVRTVDTAARLGGDEFTVLLEKVKNADAVRVVTARLLDQLSRPYAIAGGEAQLSASIGVCLYPVNARASEDLLKLADAAMYRAKRAGKNQVEFYAAEAPADVGSVSPRITAAA
ncbi:MAG: GGDEF domain-containing protein [Myxococcota bacterium]|nr:GGDEF domain-containing protein [Myxococcota bacterium]